MLPPVDPGIYNPDEDVHKITDYRCVSADMQHTSLKERLYLHLDMNCFYAQVEQQCFKLHGLPVYIEGWYTGNAERMERALHPKLAKRLVAHNPQNDRSYLVQTSALELVQQTRQGIGTHTPEAEQRTDITILDIYENAASVRVNAGHWIDYMHIGKWNGEWKIINVLWAQRPKTQ